MVNITKILASADVTSLRSAVADAFEELSLEMENSEKIAALGDRVKTLEDIQ